MNPAKISRRTEAAAPRGSTLLMVVILLAVLAAVGVAAVSLGSQERINASAKGKLDRLAACANAAQMLIWAETAKYGTGRLQTGMPASAVRLADGTQLALRAHYGQDAVTVTNLRRYTSPLNSGSGGGAIDCTNGYCPDQSLTSRQAYEFVVRCRDAQGREFEVEFTPMLLF